MNAPAQSEWLDVTIADASRTVMAPSHPISQVTEEVTAIFADMGFSVAEGPRIDTDWYNFDALNIPGHHPARAEMDTFYMHRGAKAMIARHMCCAPTPRPVQIRSMEAHLARPLRMICARRCVPRGLRPDPHARCFIRSKGWRSTRRYQHGQPEMGALKSS